MRERERNRVLRGKEGGRDGRARREREQGVLPGRERERDGPGGGEGVPLNSSRPKPVAAIYTARGEAIVVRKSGSVAVRLNLPDHATSNGDGRGCFSWGTRAHHGARQDQCVIRGTCFTISPGAIVRCHFRGPSRETVFMPCEEG